MILRITAPHFIAGAALSLQGFVENPIAPIISYMVGWPIDKVRLYCMYKEWSYEILELHEQV